jgi:hypothetical protein
MSSGPRLRCVAVASRFPILHANQVDDLRGDPRTRVEPHEGADERLAVNLRSPPGHRVQPRVDVVAAPGRRDAYAASFGERVRHVRLIAALSSSKQACASDPLI